MSAEPWDVAGGTADADRPRAYVEIRGTSATPPAPPSSGEPWDVATGNVSAQAPASANEDTSVRSSIMKALETLGEPFAKFGEYGADAIRHPIDSAKGIGIGLIKGTKDLMTLPDKIAYRAGLLDEPPQEFPNIDRAYAAAPPIAGVARVAPSAIALGPLGAAGGVTGLALDLGANAALSAGEAYGAGASPSDVGKAAAFGFGGSAGGRVLARTLRGVTPSDNARELLRGDVVPTPGALGGMLPRALENAATVVPGAGDVINYSRASALRQAARSEINRATAPVDTSVGRAGAGAVDEANAGVSGAYTAAKGTTHIYPDAAGDAVVNSINGWSQIPGIGNREQQWLAQFVRNEVWPIVQQAAAQKRPITGAEFKAMDAKIGEQAYKFASADDPLRQPIGHALYDLKNRLFLQLEGPGAQALRDADAAYSAMRPVTAAASRAPGGQFTPQQLHRQGVNSPFNTAARESLPTPSGGLVDAIRGTGTLYALFNGHFGMGAAAATAATAALYSKDGVGVLTSGLVGIVPYAALRVVGQQSPAKAMSILADWAAKYPQVGQALSTTLSRYGADYAARRQQQPEMQQ